MDFKILQYVENENSRTAHAVVDGDPIKVTVSNHGLTFFFVGKAKHFSSCIPIMKELKRREVAN